MNVKNKENIGKKMKQKKKKKHIFLKVVLILAITVSLIWGVKWLSDRAAYKEFGEVAESYPFVFSDETNATWYVTDNFTVPMVYTNAEGEELSVCWESSNEKFIQFQEDGTAVVNRPESESKTVTITVVYRKFLGKAEMEYQLNVAAKSSMSVEDVDVVTLEELSNQTYNRDMRAILSDNGELNFMIGDFKGTYVNCVEDAQVILEAYREQFQTPEEYEFVLDQVVDTTTFMNYRFDLCYQGYKVQGAVANVTTDKSDGSVQKIDIDSSYSMNGKSLTEYEWNYEEIINAYILENDKDNNAYQRIVFEKESVIIERNLTKIYDIMYENGAYYEMCINTENGQVIEYRDNLNSLLGYEAVTSEGVTEQGQTVTLDTKKDVFGNVMMHDMERDIHVYNNEGWFDMYREASGEDVGIGTLIGGLVDYGVSSHMNFEIEAVNGYINNSVAVQSQYYITKTYDWYQNMFGLISYDGKGSPITIVTNYSWNYDNAYSVGEGTFWISPAKDLKYSVSSTQEVLAHEYTHAVFASKFSETGGSECEEIGGINEGYADIMACLSSESTNWIIGMNEDVNTGEKVCIRDIANINRDSEELSSIKIIKGNIFPETYKDTNWSGERHEISVLISHVGYEMWASELFTSEEVAKIWYDSLAYGYKGESTYLTVREYILNAARKRNCSEEQILFIENAFAEVGIGEYPNVLETKSSVVEGDMILDDTVTSKYLVVVSTIGTVFGGNGIFIFELENGASEEQIAETGERLTQMFNAAYPNATLSGEDAVVEYSQIDSAAMDVVIKFCEESKDYLEDVSFQAIGVTEENVDEESGNLIKTIISLGITWEVKEGTAYEVYDELGLIE